MTPQTGGRTYYPALDVLRGIAILLVFFYHNFQFLQVFEFGWMGVDLFFVLSGFLITDILLTAKNEKNFFRNFYARRLLRIFPLYYITLMLFFGFAPLFFSQQNMNLVNYYEHNQLWFWTHLQNWLFVNDGLTSSPFLTHFWSLAVEEQFYLFWPLVIFLLNSLRKIRFVIIALIIVAFTVRIFIWYQSPADMVKYYCNTLTRMDSLLMGCLLAVWLKEGKVISNKTIKCTLILCSAFFAAALIAGKNLTQTNPFFSTIGYTIVSIFFATLVYLFIKSEFRLLCWLRKSVALNYIGKISFGIYVFHIPIYLILSSLMLNFLQQNGLSLWTSLFMVAACSLILTLMASTLSFYFFEKPILTLKKHFR
jgi:peptidoglycan/LPS O-acetylase OafA/YrhL